MMSFFSEIVKKKKDKQILIEDIKDNLCVVNNARKLNIVV